MHMHDIFYCVGIQKQKGEKWILFLLKEKERSKMQPAFSNKNICFTFHSNSEVE